MNFRRKQGTLKIEYFGPIKKAEIDIKQLMLFIGPQGSGKSTILKLLATINDLSFRILNIRSWAPEHDYGDLFNYDEFLDYIEKTYELNGYLTRKSKIYYSDSILEFQIEGGVVLKSDIKTLPSDYPNRNLFIPAERVFISTFSNSIQTILTHKIPISNVILKFGSDWEYAKKNIPRFKIDFLNVTYENIDGVAYIYSKNKLKFKLSDSASGFQSAIPMCLIIQDVEDSRDFFSNALSNVQERDENEYKHQLKLLGVTRAIFIEEPEINLFPDAQKGLIEYLTKSLINYDLKPHTLSIATHSPYVLTSLDNLIQAGNIYKAHPDLDKEISKIIPKECWIDFDKVSAYYLEGGFAENILDKERRSLNSEKIDRISHEIAIEFDKLLDLKYPHKNVL